MKTTQQFECSSCNHIGYAKVIVRPEEDIVQCTMCDDVLTELEMLDADEELPDIECELMDLDLDGFDLDYGELD